MLELLVDRFLLLLRQEARCLSLFPLQKRECYSSHLTLRLTWNIKRKRSAELPVLHDSNTYRCTPLHWAPLTCWCCLCHWWWGSGPSPVCLLWRGKPQSSLLDLHCPFIQYKDKSFDRLVWSSTIPKHPIQNFPEVTCIIFTGEQFAQYIR